MIRYHDVAHYMNIASGYCIYNTERYEYQIAYKYFSCLSETISCS